MRINEDYIDNVSADKIANNDRLSMDLEQNVQWLLSGQYTNIDFNIIQKPIYKVRNYEILNKLIRKCILKYDYDCNLNWIDVSGIKSMQEVFFYSKFNGDISKWDVSNVTNMRAMFEGSLFDGDIS